MSYPHYFLKHYFNYLRIIFCNLFYVLTFASSLTKQRRRTVNANNMKRISKHFDTMKKASQYLNRLYNKYDNAKLISFPTFSESGTYIFEVK